MRDLTRRKLIQGAAATGTLGMLGAVSSPIASAAPPAKLTDIDHVIILTKENRSFDHYFGTLRGVRGLADPAALRLSNGRSVYHQPDQGHADGYVMPFRLN